LERPAAPPVGNAHHRDHEDGGVADDALLDVGRADAVAAARDEVVLAPFEPEIAVLVLDPEIAGREPVADEFLARRLRLAPVFEEKDRVGAPRRDHPGLASWLDPPALADPGDRVAGAGASHRARPPRHQRGAVADQEIGLGLAVELVDVEAERRPPPAENILAQRLAAAADRAHAER